MAESEKAAAPVSGQKTEAKPADVAVASEKPLAGSYSHSQTSDEEPVPHLHAKTFLAVFSVCLIYFAQLVNLVGAGAVSRTSPPPALAPHLGHSRSSVPLPHRAN